MPKISGHNRETIVWLSPMPSKPTKPAVASAHDSHKSPK